MCEQCGGAIARPALVLCACPHRRKKKPLEPSTSAPKATAQYTDDLLKNMRRKLKESEDSFERLEILHVSMDTEGFDGYMADLKNVRDKFVDLGDALDCVEKQIKRIKGLAELADVRQRLVNLQRRGPK